jgi:hypothetical protein
VAEARLGAAGLGLAAPQRSVGARGYAQNAGYGAPWIPVAQSYTRSVSLIGQTKITPHFVQRLFAKNRVLEVPECDTLPAMLGTPTYWLPGSLVQRSHGGGRLTPPGVQAEIGGSVDC